MPVQPVDLPAAFDFLYLHARNPGRYPYLLETLATDPGRGDDGFDILFAFPGSQLRLDGAFHLSGPGAAGRADFLDALDAWWLQERLPSTPETPLPFHGGWFLLLAYELLHQIEPRVASHRPASGTVAIAVRVPVALLRKRRTGQAWIVGEPGHEGECAALASDLQSCIADPIPVASPQPVALEAREPDPVAFEAAVDAVRARIARGDVYQVNLARHWSARLPPGVTAPDLYRRLRLSNPAPFAGLATFGDWSVVSSSPERLVRNRAGLVDTRPIAGTRPRAEDPRREDAMRRNLLASPKERAEHVMLIDLERNDLGRVCVPGTVEVDEFMAIETYRHVHHIVSNVRGRLRDDVTPGRLIRAMFPGGTITGCPKVRCLELIGELEPLPRGPYTGSMGYLNRDGSCDLNILIRSFVLRDRELSFAAGSGIVADSTPARELAETRAKAKGLLLALEG